MKKLIKKINVFLALPVTNIVVGIADILASFVVVIFEGFYFMNFFCGATLGIGIGLLFTGIDDFFDAKCKEKTGH